MVALVAALANYGPRTPHPSGTNRAFVSGDLVCGWIKVWFAKTAPKKRQIKANETTVAIGLTD